jgi:uncharacterized membrane protein
MKEGGRMKSVLIASLMVAALAGAAAAAEIMDRMKFSAKNGVVIYYHNNHVNEVKGDCKICHAGEPGKIKGFGKEYAHKNCIPCHDGHDDMPEGPTTCEGCHKQ